ncbi:MAG: hypothetical protein MRERC_9c010 [Mycoplasmataceae bacterium RC_NB112A]|nr:MAG: hypothetical protein MRERC_9c010 [Mycoplasmataceae bacterium RC_NB112A]
MVKINEYINTDPKPVQVEEIRYIEETRLPKLSEITDKDGKVKLSPEFIDKLRDPNAGFRVDLTVFPLQVDYWGEWEYLEIPCVSKTCSIRDDVARQWYHDSSECRSYSQKMAWSTKARVKCIYCDRPSHIRYWQFKCHRCPSYGDFDGTKFLTAIRIVSKISPVHYAFTDKLYDYMVENQSEFK